MFPELTDDEYEIVRHKLESARYTNLKISGQIDDFIDGLEFDYPYIQRSADMDNYGSVNAALAFKMSEALTSAANTGQAHYMMASEFRELAQW